MDEKTLEEVEKLVKPTYLKIRVWTHGWPHVVNVVSAAKKIAIAEGADVVACQVAAYCHDLGRLEEEERNLVNPIAGSPSQHALLSVEPTEKVLDEVGIHGKARNQIIEAVKLHNIKKYEGDNQILNILQDADRADGFSPMAVLRFAAFNLELPVTSPEGPEDIEKKFNWVNEQLASDDNKTAKMIDTLDFVLNWYETLLNTKSAKVILEDGYRFLKNYRDGLADKLK